MEETKEKLKSEYATDFRGMLEDLKLADAVINMDGIIFEWSMNWWLSKLDPYADAKIDLMFSQEANRGGGMIKVRGENGVTMMTKEQLAELDKSK